MIATIKPKTERKKRVRTFFKSKEIAHQWAHQLVPFANSPGNMKFRERDFISYSTVIGRVVAGAKGQRGYVLNVTRYSPSTSAHQSEVRRAIPHDATVFEVGDKHARFQFNSGRFIDLSPVALVQHYHVESVASFNRGENVKSRTRASDYQNAANFRDKARSVDKFFGTKHAASLSWTHLRGIAKKIAAAIPLDAAGLEKKRLSNEKRAASVITNRIARAEQFIAAPTEFPAPPWRERWHLSADLRARIDAAMPAHERHREEQRNAFVLGLAQKFIADPAHNEAPADIMRLPKDVRLAVEQASVRKNALRIEAWQRGEHVYLPRDLPAMLRTKESKMETSASPWQNGVNESLMLRTKESKMETSLGVTVPLADAERTFKFITAIRHGRGNWHRNGEQFAIGDFQLDAVNPQGVVAGCHRVSWEEIDRFSALMGWV